MDNDENKAERAYELASGYEQSKEHCVQCTLAAIMEVMGVIDEDLFKAADGLTGGTALSTQGTCGALAGGILAISRLTGRSYEGFKTGISNHTWQYVFELQKIFEEKYGGITGELVQKKIFGRSYQIKDKQDRKLFENAGAHVNKCPVVCGNVAKWSVEIINRIQPD